MVWAVGDGKRLKKGFDDLEATVDRWPAPASLLKLMPPRKAGGALALAERTPEVNEQGLLAVREIMDTLKDNFA